DNQRSRWFETKANAARSSGENQIARLTRHGLRKLGDLLPNVEDEVPSVRVLTQFAIDERAHPQHVRIRDFVGCDYARTKRTMRVERLSEHPLWGFLLPIANGNVIADRIAKDMVRSSLCRNPAPLLADDDDELDLVVKLIRHDGLVYCSERGIHRSRLFAEPHLFGWNFHSGGLCLFNMVSVVQSYSQYLARARNRRK